ncbi:hypothetical protein BV898_05231 [Hypsibius exemplaris]|uniref:Uncharacterized protein n=1 Tax=Hypsibius exemplaris TaxID=2072580 RepID=A0A1W0X098_HYPEX|nr:hypothetical protein BV898_05231 [Hypsibius exemplaris]
MPPKSLLLSTIFNGSRQSYTAHIFSTTLKHLLKQQDTSHNTSPSIRFAGEAQRSRQQPESLRTSSELKELGGVPATNVISTETSSCANNSLFK